MRSKLYIGLVAIVMLLVIFLGYGKRRVLTKPTPGSIQFRLHDDSLQAGSQDIHLPFPSLLSEEETMSMGKLQSMDGVTDPGRSTMTLIGGNSQFELGDWIKVLITLFDSKGNRKTKGGEVINILLTGNDPQQTSVPGVVTDNGEGSYEAEVEALWSGRSTITAYLRYSREAIAAMYRMRREMISTRIIDAVFNSGTHSETTHCHPDRSHLVKLTGYSSVCNLTYINSGMPWYCGKPRNIHLLCEDWSANLLQATPTLPVTTQEQTIIGNGRVLLGSPISVTVAGTLGIRITLPTIPCGHLSRESLWRQRHPTGFFHNGTWFLRRCQVVQPKQISECLQNRTVYLNGDSTLRDWYKEYFLTELRCKPTTENWTQDKWHKPASCYHEGLNLRVSWRPHSQPFSVGEGQDVNSYTIYSIARFIDDIPNEENAFIVIHLYMHIVPFHHSMFKMKMIRIRDTVSRLLLRNKQAVVFIKAPHTYEDSPSGNVRLNDFFGYVFTNILFEVFKGLHDKVIFLNNRDSSDALKLKWNHPPPPVCKAMVLQMLSFGCS